MKYRTISIIFLLSLFFIVNVSAASESVPDEYFKNKKGRIGKAHRHYKLREYEKAERILQRYWHTKNIIPADVFDAKLLLARIHYETKEYSNSLALYREIAKDRKHPLPAHDICDYIDLLRKIGSVTEAIEIGHRYIKLMSRDIRFANQMKSLTSYYGFNSRKVMESKFYADTVNLGMSDSYIYGFHLYKDGFVFLANKLDHNDRNLLYVNSKLYQVTNNNIVKPFDGFKRIFQNGPVSFFNEDQSVVFTDNKYRGTNFEEHPYRQQNNLQLYISHLKKNGRWGKPIRISRFFAKKAHKYSFLHPSMVKMDSCMRLYFASDMPGGYGGTDLYFCDYELVSRKWNKPVNLGKSINTNGNELYPEVRQDTLLFSSNGLSGYGGQDLFMTNINHLDKEPFHFPYPVNTQFDDISLTHDSANGILYFSSNRTAEPQKESPEQVFKLKPGIPIAELRKSVADSVQMKNYLDHSDEIIDLIGSPESRRHKIVHFAFNKCELDLTGIAYLDELYKEWSDDRTSMICIEGHTDQTGMENYNIKLSELRAKAVSKYMLKRGIPFNQLRVSWYGALIGTRTVKNTSDKDEVEQINSLNRRAEAFICKIND